MIGELSDRILVVANPAAARVTAGVVDAVTAELAKQGGTVDVRWTARAGDAAAIAARAIRRGEVNLIVAVGGDGTVQEIAHGLVNGSVDEPTLANAMAARPTVLVLPAGSGNSTAKNLWGEMGWAEILDMAFDTERSCVRAIDLLHLVEPDLVAVLGASSGFLAAVLSAAQQLVDLPRGLDRYHAAASSVLAAMPAEPTRVRVDGEVVFVGSASLVAVGGGRYRAQSLKLLPDSILDDGCLDLCVLPQLRGQELADVAVEVLSGDHIGRTEVTYRRGRQVTIERVDGRPLLAEYDGNVWATAGAHLTVDILPGAISVMAARNAPGG